MSLSRRIAKLLAHRLACHRAGGAKSLSNIEIIICLLLLFMALPDVCRKLGRPALAFSAFVIFSASATVTTLN